MPHKIFIPFLFLLVTSFHAAHAEFKHPGVAHSRASIDFVKAKIASGEEPWVSAWRGVQSSRYADLGWNPKPHAHVERGASNNPDIGSSDFTSDANAAYVHSLHWLLTGNVAHAKKAVEILNAWSGTLESISNHDARLLVGMDGYDFCNAAELLKHTWDGWPRSEQTQFKKMLREIFYPVIEDFYPSANGNWDASMLQTMLAMGVYLDDQAMFDRGVEYYLNGKGNGAVRNYFKPSGQCQESGRDQAHTQMGLDYLACTCEVAWNQGVDLYGAYNNRLLKGFEYSAKYNLSFDVPYEPYRSFEGRYHYKSISDDSRGRLRPIYEKVLNHYGNRKGLDAEFTRQAAMELREDSDGRESRDRRSRGRRSRRRRSSVLDTLMFSGQKADLSVSTKETDSVPLPSPQHKDHYPEFTWDRIPLYMHIRKSRRFTQEELNYLAHFPLITLEKTTGSATYGSSEDGSREAAKAIKAVNPNTCVLYYRNVMCNYNTYKVNKGLRDIPGAFLKARNGKTKLHRGVREVYDLSNPFLRKWWVDHCVDMTKQDEIDGLFLDGNIKALESGFLKKEIGEKRKQEVAKGYAIMMQDLNNRIPADKLLVANIIRARLPNFGLDYMQYFDGSYLEGIESQANGLSRLEYLVKGIDVIQQAARSEKIICMSMGLGKAATSGLRIDDSRQDLKPGANTQPRLEYCLALFLICAERYSYVFPHDGYDVNNNRSTIWLKQFAEYDKPLGSPQGPATKNGYTYTREFKHASVFLDIEKEEAKITWR